MASVNALGREGLERATRKAGIDVPPVWLEQTGSTNADAQRMASGGAPAWTVVATGHQVAGRGRADRTWVDVPQASLLFSVLLRPSLPAPDLPLVSLAAAVALIDAAGVPTLRAKWPNDVVAGERKVAGILSEARTGRDADLVIGMGVNLRQRREDFPPPLRDVATSLEAEGWAGSVEDLLAAFLRGFRDRVEAASFPSGVLGEYRRRSATVGKRVRVTMNAGASVEGLAVAIDDGGRLVLRTEDGDLLIDAGDVEHLRGAEL